MSDARWSVENFAGLNAVVRPFEGRTIDRVTATPATKTESVLVLLHGVGSNERDLARLALELAPTLPGPVAAVSLRAPLMLGPEAFGWFHVRFLESGPVHDWPQAQASFTMLEGALGEIAARFAVPTERLFVLGFSQGAIMTLGLALTGEARLGGYIACSGRTLPEFAAHARRADRALFAHRPLLLMHGTEDTKLPITHGRASRALLEELGASFTYREFAAPHGITSDMLAQTQTWLRSRE